MAKDEAERLTKIETKYEFIDQDIKEIKADLKKLPEQMQKAVKDGVTECRKIQDLKKQNDLIQPALQPKSGISGWVAAIVIGLINGIYWGGKSMGWF